MLDERHIKMIELYLTGEYTMQEIADLVGISRQTVYDWLKRDEIKREMDNRLQEIKTNASKQFDAKLDKAIDEYWELAMTTTDVRTKQIALSYWIDRALGKPVAKTEMTDNRDNKDSIDKDILADILDEDDNIIDISEAK